MYITEEYKLYRFAYELVRDKGFDLIHLDTKKSEIWLEKYEKKTSTVIRLIHKGFDWKNHLKTDIAGLFHKVSLLRKMFVGKKIDIYNIYITSHAPVDSWEELLHPLQIKERNPLKMKVFYLSTENLQEENKRIETELAHNVIDDAELPSLESQEQRVKLYKIHLARILQQKKEERESIFNYGKPFFTYILLAISVFMFLIVEIKGSSLDVQTLIEYGAKYNPLIVEGEWWRIVSSMFLHVGFLHLMMNMLALYYLGTAVEKIFGQKRFLLIYFLSGIGGGIVSFAFNMHVSAGASGALFGLFGALLYFGVIHKKLFLQTMGRSILFIVGLNLVIGFVIPQIDMSAHIGGLIFGFIAAAIVNLPKHKGSLKQFLALTVYLVAILSLSFYGVKTTEASPELAVITIEQLSANEEHEKVIEEASRALEEESDFEAELLFLRAYSYIQLENLSAAVDDLEETVSLKPELAEAHYNLSLLYYEQNKVNKAKDAISRAKELKSDKSIDKFYDQLFKDD